MADNTISMRVQQIGAEGVRQRLREINEELRHGKPVTTELRKEMNALGTQTGALNKSNRLLTQSYAAMHPNLNATARIMSGLGSIARSALLVTTAISVAWLAFGKTNSQLAEAEAGLARAHRDLNAALESGDFEAQAQAQESINIFNAKIKELKDQNLQGTATGIINFGAAFALMGNQVIQAVPKIRAGVIALGGLAALGPALGPVAGILGGFFLGVELSDKNRTFLESMQNVWDGFVQGQIRIGSDYIGFYTIDLPAAWEATRQAFFDLWLDMISIVDLGGLAITSGFRGFWNGMIELGNLGGAAIVGGINSAVSAVVNAVNTIIQAINNAAGFTGISIPTIGFSPVAFAAIPTISAAKGFSGVLPQDTMFQAHAGERVSITPASRVSSGGGGDVHIHVAGSIWALDDLEHELDKRFKGKLISRGFTGY